MKAIDENQLEHDLPYRFAYLAEFIGFGPDDAAVVLAAGPYLGPMIPELVEKTYGKLLTFEATARHFVPRQAGFAGTPPADLASVTAQHPQIQFRKEHLARYFQQILTRTCDHRLVPYLDMVGKIHTPQAGNAEIDVPLVQMNALLGFLADILTESILALPLDPATLARTLRAFHKLLWIQNDFVNRHYALSRAG